MSSVAASLSVLYLAINPAEIYIVFNTGNQQAVVKKKCDHVDAFDPSSSAILRQSFNSAN
jgi:hypothetical protein